MADNLNFHYDKEGDVLDISLGKPKNAVSLEIQDDVFVRLQQKTQKVVGFMILNFQKRFSQPRVKEAIPVLGEFSLPQGILS